MLDLNVSSPDGVRGPDDNYDKVEQEVVAEHYLRARCVRSEASKSRLCLPSSDI